MRFTILRRCLPLTLLAALLAAFPPGASAESAIRVVTTIQPVHSLIAGVTRGVSEPYQLVRGGRSPHGFALTPSDARALHRADVIFATGESVEGFLVRTARSLPDDTRLVWMQGIDGLVLHDARAGGAWEEHGHEGDDDHRRDEGHAPEDDDGHGHDAEDEHGHGDVDGHVWLDPRNAIALTEFAGELLAAMDADNAERYRDNAREQVERLQALDRELDARLAAIRDRPYLVFHDAYQYFEKRYGLTARGSVTLDPERAPGARRLNELRERVEAEDVVCVFAEPQFEPRVIRVVSEAMHARTGELDPLGANIDPGPDAYFTLLRNLAGGLEECLLE